MKASHPIRNSKLHVLRKRPVRHALIVIVAVSVSTLAADVLAEGSSPRLLARNISGENTVSTNHLLTPDRTLQAVRRARNDLIAGALTKHKRKSHTPSMFLRIVRRLSTFRGQFT
jgi:hypothetical protein